MSLQLIFLSIGERMRASIVTVFIKKISEEKQKKKFNTFLINNYLNLFKQPKLMIHQRLFVEWSCQIDTSWVFFCTVPLKCFILYFLAILVFSGIAFWIRAFNSFSQKSKKRTPCYITSLHPTHTIYHLTDSEYGSQSECNICDTYSD